MSHRTKECEGCVYYKTCKTKRNCPYLSNKNYTLDTYRK